MRFTALILSLSIFLSACGTHYHSLTQEEQAADYAKEAAEYFSKGNNVDGVSRIDLALTMPTGATKIKELFISYPNWQGYYLTYLDQMIVEVSTPSQAATAFTKISTASSTEIFPENQVNDLLTKLKKIVDEGNINGAIPFDLSDRTDLFPELKFPPHSQIIADRSIKKLQDNNSGNRPIAALVEYVQQAGADSVEGKRIEYVKATGANSAEGKRIESLLPTMNIRRDELDLVAKVYPEFARTRKEEITAKVFLQVKNGDRLFSEDLQDTLRSNVRGIELVPTPGSKTITLVIEKVRNDEKTIPERSETITYAQYQVNLLSAALLMPRNASYLYEVVSGGAEIEYGYVITANLDGKTIYDEVVRGKVGGEYKRCQNARIQNVFGGVSSAGFTANDDMQQRCSGSVAPSMEELRKQVFSKIAESVLKIPPIIVAQNN